MRRWRMKMKLGRTGRRCWSLSPNCHHCYAGRENFQGCSGRNHWTTGRMCVSVEERNGDRTQKKNMGEIIQMINTKTKPLKTTKKQMKWSQMLKSTETTGLGGVAVSFLWKWGVQPAWRLSRKLQWCVKCFYTHINGEIGVGRVCFTLSVTCWGAAEAAREERELQSPWSCPVSDISEDLEVGLGWECECSSEQAESREQTEKDRHVRR